MLLDTDPSWNISSGFQPSITSSLGKYQSENKFSELFPDSHLEFYKKVELVPHRDISGTNKVWTCYDGSLNLLEHMISYNFDNSGGSYLPILEYHDENEGYKTQDIFSEPLWWLIDEENHGISFYNTDASLNQWDISRNGIRDSTVSNHPTLTFYRYIGDTEINNDLNVSGTLDVSGALIIPVIDRSKDTSLDTSGSIIFNKDTNSFEGYSSGNWGSLGGVKSIDQRTYIDIDEDGKKLRFYTDMSLNMIINKEGIVDISRSLIIRNKLDVSGVDVSQNLIVRKKLDVYGDLSANDIKIKGVSLTASATELNHVKDVTSAIQTQIDSKQATITGAATTISSDNLTASRAIVSNTSGKVEVSDITSAELGYLDGVSSAIQNTN